jgi:hypothetical protein
MITILSLEFANAQTFSQTFNATSTFTVPVGVTSVIAETWGGGGKGGSRVSGTNGAYGGGGGGAYATAVITVVPGNTYTVTVGLGSTTTAAGGDSWFINNTTILAKGGSSVANDSATGAFGGQASASIGSFKYNGGNGANGVSGSYGGGGGSSAGNATNGTTATNNTGAIAPTGGGNGGNGRLTSNGNGSVGIALGGGGGGALRTTGSPTGGNGANGRVILTYAVPEINIQGNAVSIVDGDSTPSLLDNTDFGATNVGIALSKTYTIYNTSLTAPLSIGAISFSGTNASDFSITTAPSPIVANGSSTTFTVTFNPNSGGLRTATISIVNNDTNENPYDFSIQGTANGPEIDIQGNLTSIIDGDTTPTTTDWTDFSSIATIRTFTIFNTGNINLSIGTITVTGTNAADFSIITYPTSTILPGQSSVLEVKFLPSSTGIKNATITIVNNDFNEYSYDFSISGNGVLPNMNVKGNNAIIADGDITPSIADWTDLQSTNIGSPITRIYTIENTGTMNLNLTGTPIVTIVGTDYSVTTQPSTTTILGQNSTTFIVTFNPSSLGVKTADISISNDDAGASKNPYTFRIKCEGIQAFIDTDGDGIIDNIDLDDDNDGIPDSIEQNYASHSVLGTTLQKVLLNETFGVGTTRTRINSNVTTASTTYCYEDGTTTQAADECDTIKDLNDGQYTINYEAGSTAVASWAPTYWYQGPDHTTDTNGRMALFNATNDITDEFYRTIVQGITANAPLTYSFWILNLDRTDAPGIASRNRPNISVEFRDLSNNLISTISTGDIAPTSATNPTGDWYNFSATFIPVTTGFSIVFRNNQPGGLGNDLALDDILITQILTDTDQDGSPDVYDLDSDNDGIGGIIEDGWAALSNGKDRMDLSSGVWIDANNNGWHDTAEAYYATNLPANFDGDAVPNYIDLDSDNDSIFDVDEAGLLNGDGDVNCDGQGDGTDTDGDGILTPFDTLVGFGNSGKSLPTDTLGSGSPDYLNVASKTPGIYDISTTLYANLDTNNDGIIDGSADVDRDGIIDAFDTDTNFYGSPRDLNRKLFLDFDGRNDYGQGTAVLGGLSNASLMAWINLNTSFSSDGIIVGQDKFQLRINSSKKLEAVVNGTTLTYNIALVTQQWYNIAAVYGGGTLKLYLNGNMVTSVAASGSIAADASLLTIGKNPTANNKFFKGKIDEIRVFNIALTNSQLQRMVYQEIQNTSSQVRGLIIPKDVGGLPFANVLRYYRMDVYKNDIIDDLSTPTIDIGTGMKIYNNKNIYVQQAPMPFITERNGDFATAANSPTNEVRGMDVMDQDWSIIQVKHDITETSNNIDLGMLVDSGKTIVMDNDTKIQNDWYLKLDGKIDLQGKSQLFQTTNSDLDPSSSGSLERDQQGNSNLYNYNYWSSPVGTINSTSNNNSYTVADIMKDGTIGTPENIVWTAGYNGSPTSPITLSSFWIYKFTNNGNAYANWQYVGQNGAINAGEGYTLKGSGATSENQNYIFTGKPNNGTITNTIAAENINLSGNPYASALDANDFINDNLTSTTGTLYFWEHYSTNNTHILRDYQGGYAAINLVGGTPPVAPPGSSGLGSSTRIPGRYIPVGQGFFVVGSATGGSITFNNGQRDFVKEDNVQSNPMFKNSSSIVSSNFNTNNYKKIRLGFTSNNNYHRQILLGFMEDKATSAIDKGYDAIHIDNQPSDMYFLNGGTKLNIQGEGEFDEENIYPIGVKTNVAGNVTFMVDASEKMNNKNMYIYDNTTHIYHNITNDSLTINLPIGTLDNRFSLRFKKRNNNSNEHNNHKVSQEISEKNLIVFVENDNINIQNNADDNKIKTVVVFNMLGQSVATYEIENQDQQQIKLSRNNTSTGTYIVKMITDQGDASRKIVFN